MLGKLCALAVFLTGTLCAHQEWKFEGELKPSEDALFVSLGACCDFAWACRASGYREAAFPFDWLVTCSNVGLIEVLDKDFQFFTAESCLKKDYYSKYGSNVLENDCYEILFVHEWYDQPAYEWSDLEKYKKHLDRMQVKFSRRIGRFRALRDYPGKVFFLRNPCWDQGALSWRGDLAEENAEQAIALRAALERYFPSLDFTLVIVKFPEQRAPDIGPVEGILEYQLAKEELEGLLVQLYH